MTNDPTLTELCTAIAEVYKPEGCWIWLTSPQRALKGRSAIQAWDEGDGREVYAVIRAIAEGAFV